MKVEDSGYKEKWERSQKENLRLRRDIMALIKDYNVKPISDEEILKIFYRRFGDKPFSGQMAIDIAPKEKMLRRAYTIMGIQHNGTSSIGKKLLRRVCVSSSFDRVKRGEIYLKECLLTLPVRRERGFTESESLWIVDKRR